jgi:hypothetical protein
MDWTTGFIAPYTFTTSGYKQYSAIADLHTSQFTVTQALGFSASIVVSWQRIYDSLWLQITHQVFFSQPNSSLPIILDSIQFICSQVHIPAGWRLETRLFTSRYCSISQSQTQSQSPLQLTVSQSVSQSVSLGVESHLGLMTRYLLLFDSYGLVFVGRSLWREDGSVFLYAADPCQRSLSQVPLPCDSHPYFTVSDLRLPFSSPPTTRRVTVEVLLFYIAEHFFLTTLHEPCRKQSLLLRRRVYWSVA